MSLFLPSLLRRVNSQPAQVLGRLVSTSSVLSSERGVNKVQLLGRVGNQPKEFTSPSTGKKLVAFAVATSVSYKTKGEDGNETTVSKTTWHSINVFKPHIQDIAMKYMQKGSRIFINGRLHNYTKDTKEGAAKFVTVVIADDLIHLQLPKSAEMQGGGPVQGGEFQGGSGGQDFQESPPEELGGDPAFDSVAENRPGLN